MKQWDRRTVDTFRKCDGWIGYAEDHGIVLDFGDRLSRFSPQDRLMLCLAGWVEYPYSQTNYAAATAGVVLRPPAIERRRDDGSWEAIEAHAGYPAGLPRLSPGQFNPNGMQRRVAGQAGFQYFFTEANRPFCLYAVIGSHRQAVPLTRQVNAVLEQIEVA